ncbi:MAG: hypothetical protein KGI26_07350, partial [Thaumarchaeota archaeon]|nr:hypothetical protein [Nitrososphaerota archaeon]
IQLHINYSSPAQGAYTYRFSYVAAGGATFVFEDRVLVSHYATFTAEHFVPVSGTPVTVLAEVYRGAPSDGALVFSEALTV